MQINVYTMEDAEGGEVTSFCTENYQKAKEYAIRAKLRVICNVYEWDDSYMVDDFTKSAADSENDQGTES